MLDWGEYFNKNYINSGIGRTIVSQPFDCLRIHMQNSNKLISTHRAVLDIYKKNGIRGFYKGMTPFLLGNICLLSIYSNTYNKYKKDYGSFVSGGIGGFYGSYISNVIEYYRCSFYNKNHKKFNFSTISKSYPITGLRDIIGWGSFFATYDYSKKVFKNLPEPVHSLVVGSLSGIALWTSMYPLDTIKTRIQTESSFKNLRLWAGYSSCLIRAIPVNATIVYFMN